MSQRRSNRSQADEDVPDLAEPIKECVRFIVCREGSKIPIRRSEIVKHLVTVCQTPSNQINNVVLGANNLLKKDMWKFLEEAGLLEENDHAGRKILTTTFTRQLYLSYSK
ncbi:MAGE-like protein 2, partial [Operophtera brumata]